MESLQDSSFRTLSLSKWEIAQPSTSSGTAFALFADFPYFFSITILAVANIFAGI